MLLDVAHKELKWRNGFFCLSWKATSVCTKMLNMQTMHNRSLAGKQQSLTVHYGLVWSASVLCSLFSLLTGDVASAMKWHRLRKFPALPQASHSSQEMLPLLWSDTDWESSPPSPQAFITSSSLYKRQIRCQNLPQRGRWFLTLAFPRYEVSPSILLKKFLI